jgi:hypothetical protein
MSERAFNTEIDQALTDLDRSIIEATLKDDPLRLPLTALSSFLKAQRQLHADSTQTLRQQIEAARQPIQDEQLRRAVIAGVSAHAASVIRALRWRTVVAATAIVVAAILLGVATGAVGASWYFQHENAAALAWGKATMAQCADAKDECRPVIRVK